MISGRQDPSQRRARIQAARAARAARGSGGGGPTRFGAALRGAAQGFTVGLSDEMTGLARGVGAMWPSGMSPGEAYTAGTEGARERNRASREAFPWTYGGSEVAGAIGPMVGAALMTGGAGAAPVAASMVGRAGRALATKPLLGTMTARTATRPIVGGAIEGAAHGFGHAEGMPWERGLETGLGAGFGVAAGGVAQGLTRGGGHLGGRAMDLMGLRAATAESTENAIPRLLRKIPGVETIQQQAERRVAQALPEGGQLTPDPAGQGPGTFEGRELQEAVELLEAQPERALMDIDRRMQGTARGAATVPGSAKEDIPAFLRERHAGQEGRLIDGILELSDQDVRQSFRESTTEIMARRKAAADPLYDAAHYNPDGSLRTVSRDVVQGEDNALNHQQLRDAYERGRKIARLGDVELPPLVQTMSVGGDLIGEEILEDIPVMGLDYMKRGLDDLIQGSQGSGQGMARHEARELRDILDTMLGRIDEEVSEYGAARAKWKGGAEELEALETGRRLFLDPVSDTQYLVSQMSEGEREMFLRGGVEGLAQRLENIPKGRDVTSARPLADRTADTERLRMLFPGDEAFQAFQGQLENEVRMASSNRFINQQSMTVDKALEVAEMSGVDTAMLMSGGGGLPAMALRAGREALRGRMTSYSGDVAEQMTPLLTAQGQNAADLTRRLMRPQQQSIQQELVTRGIPTVAGATLAGRGGVPEESRLGGATIGPREREMAMGRVAQGGVPHTPGMAEAAGITEDQMAYLRSQGLTEEQIGLLAGSLTEQGVSDVMARRYGYRGVG